ncbi:type IV secretion system protein VirB7 [Sinorhizobium fredii]
MAVFLLHAHKGDITMIRIALLLCAASAINGCATFSQPLPKCDGYSRRPLNRSMWQHNFLLDRHSGLNPAELAGLRSAYAEEGPADRQSNFDLIGSYLSCAR